MILSILNQNTSLPRSLMHRLSDATFAKFVLRDRAEPPRHKQHNLRNYGTYSNSGWSSRADVDRLRRRVSRSRLSPAGKVAVHKLRVDQVRP